jgi:cyclopropane fatty-acyl-phospholipid synthase-like methyltransferase
MGWSEDDSRLYQELARIAVPERAEQIATLLTLLPFGVDDTAHVVELGCGEGRLSLAVLAAYPRATVLALDGSEEMRAATALRLQSFDGRARIELFDLASEDWWPLLADADAVVSSLAVHHLDGPGKQRLFAAVSNGLRSAVRS